MRKCTFLDLWLEDSRFKDWLRPVVGNSHEAYCHVCKKTINITWVGVNEVKSHMKSNSHQAKMRGRSEQLPISMFCATAASTTSTSTALHSTSTALPMQTTASSSPSSIVNRCVRQQTLWPITTATLRAEVLWCLDLATKRHSFNSNDGIGELFQNMFPDSDIAKFFTLGKDKSAYMIKFGIAPYFKKQLLETINKAGPFVLMFDESLNQSFKKKIRWTFIFVFWRLVVSGQDILAPNSWDTQELMTCCSISNRQAMGSCSTSQIDSISRPVVLKLFTGLSKYHHWLVMGIAL
ncbi:hypothetical protein M9458_052522 [Cirrhinus mrigala]|uniref:BED-type domain-containing protein n=1 Tax=Cirrhinus mrigala TaxID=683832 RepID=A0ABD0MUS0_CIRMR